MIVNKSQERNYKKPNISPMKRNETAYKKPINGG